MSDQAIKKFRRGELLYKEGDSLNSVFFIQSGRVALNLVRSEQKTLIMQLSNADVVGEQAVSGQIRQNHNAEALSEVKALEIPIDKLQQAISGSHSIVKIFLNGISDSNKKLFHEARAHSLEAEHSPCPQPYIARIFCILNLVCRHLGKDVDGLGISIDWTVLKLYTTRMLLGSPVRMERTLEILKKLKYLELEYEADEEDQSVEVLNRILIKNISIIEDFGEFYQFQYYKGGKSEVIELDSLAVHIAASLVGQSEELEADRRGLIALAYQDFLNKSKTDYGLEVRDTHWGALERKGLFVKRSSNEDGPQVSFEKDEFQRVYSFWKIIAEINKWNLTGKVDVNENLDFKKGIDLTLKCSECNNEITTEAKFCSQCGHKAAA